jgi:hypothetical protein
VATSQESDWDEFIPYLQQAFVDPEKPLPANPAGVEKLNAALQAIQQPPAAQPVPQLPVMAQTVSGQTFELATNPIHLASVSLEFDESSEAVMQIAFDDGRPSWTVPVGLDGVYRMYPGENNLPAGGRGHWADADTFVVQIDTIGNRETLELGIDFKGDLIDFSVREGTHAEGFTVAGRLKD